MNVLAAIDWDKFMNNDWTVAIVSGLVVTIVGGVVVALILGRYASRQSSLEEKIEIQAEIAEAKEKTPQLTSSALSTPSRQDKESAGYKLVKKMNDQSPYLREAAEDAYIGQRIKQLARYIDIDKVEKEDDLFRIVLVSAEGYPWLYGTIRLSEYPWLKTLKRESYVKVDGEIVSFRSHEIGLKDVKLSSSS
jgi:hypothetical protein